MAKSGLPAGVYADVKFYNGQITVYEDRVVITRKGLMPMFYQGYSGGSKTIPISSITAVEFKKQGMKQGFIHFSVSGEGKLAKSYNAMVKDENTVTFIPSDQKTALQVKELVEKLMTRYRQAAQSPAAVQQAAPGSAADELLKLKQLLDAGALTQEEFDATKKRILGL